MNFTTLNSQRIAQYVSLPPLPYDQNITITTTVDSQVYVYLTDTTRAGFVSNNGISLYNPWIVGG